MSNRNAYIVYIESTNVLFFQNYTQTKNIDIYIRNGWLHKHILLLIQQRLDLKLYGLSSTLAPVNINPVNIQIST